MSSPLDNRADTPAKHPATPAPTDRELALLRVLWERGEATVRQIYEDLREDLPIVQNIFMSDSVLSLLHLATLRFQ